MAAAVSATSSPSSERSRKACCCRRGSSPSAFSRAIIASLSLKTPDRLGLGTGGLLDRVRYLVILLPGARWQPGDDAAAHGAAALHVTDSVLEDTVEKWLPLFRRPCRIGACQLQHGILDRIKSVVLVAQRRLGNPECLQLDAGQELVQRAVTGLSGGIGKVHVAVKCGRHVIRRRERSKLRHGLYNARTPVAVDRPVLAQALDLTYT